MKPTKGRIVRYALAPGDLDEKHQGQVGQVRPAVIVETHGNEKFDAFESGSAVNLQVFLDGSNDGYPFGLLWKTSALFSDTPGKPGTWSWPLRAD